MGHRTGLIAGALALVGAAPASAAEVSLRVAPPEGVRLGNPSLVSGRVTEGGVPVAGRAVALELRRHPFDGAWRPRTTALSDESGRFAFGPRLARNHEVRVRVPAAEGEAGDTLSAVRNAYVLPAFTLSYRQRGRREIRIVQTYTVPRAVTLKAPTRLYVGPCKPGQAGRCTGTHARLRARAETRRVRPGRYVARATVRIPASYQGRFRYVSCFAYTPGSGMGDPDARCPRKYVRVR